MMRPVTVLFLLSAAAGTSRADVVLRTNGESLKEVTVLEETVAEVVYEKAGERGSVASEGVLRVRYEELPAVLDEAQAAEISF